MWKVKQIEVKNRTYYFYNDIINIEEFHSNLLKIDIDYIGYITIKKIGECENIDRVNPMYLIIGKKDGHIKGKNGSKYLVFESMDENKEVLKSAQNFGIWLKIKMKQWMVVKKVNMIKISWKLNSIQIIICD